MIEDAFVNLYCHSVFSFNQSLVTPEGLAEEASDKLMPSVAITDNCNLHGAVRFAKRSAELGIKPIIGCEFPGSVLQGHGGQAPGLILICKDGQGYRNLCRLVSLAQKAAASDNVISRALLCFLTKGLIAISPPGGASGLSELFEEGDFYLGIDHNLKYDKDLREKTGLPLVGISDVRFLRKEDAPLFDKLLRSAPPDAAGGLKPFLNNDLYFKDDSELMDLFLDHPEAIHNTVEIAEKCRFGFEFGRMRVPGLSASAGRDLEGIARGGLDDILAKQEKTTGGLHDEYRARLELELSVIENLDLERPIWMLWDVCRALEAHEVLFQAQKRSSSLVYYCLGISAVDPVRHGLPFDGFRRSDDACLPEMDVYLPLVGKDFLIEYLRDKYGVEKVSAKATAYKAFHDNDFPERDWMPREASAATTTVVIGDGNLREIAPVSFDEDGETVLHYHRKDIRQLGLFCFWCFESKQMDILRETLRIVGESGKKPPRLRDIPLDDEKTLALFAEGETTGIHDFHTKTMTEALKELKPVKFEQLTALYCLCSLKAWESGLLRDYLNRAHNRQAVSYITDELMPVLEETCGLLLYDKQILRIMTDYAGILAYEAMSFLPRLKKGGPETIARIGEQFSNGAAKRGHGKEEISAVWDMIEISRPCATSKAKAVSDVMPAYWTQYLYANYDGPWQDKNDKRRML